MSYLGEEGMTQILSDPVLQSDHCSVLGKKGQVTCRTARAAAEEVHGRSRANPIQLQRY